MQLPHDNLTKSKLQVIEQLNNREDIIIIAQADNGGATAILDTNDYLKEAKRQLNNKKVYQKPRHNSIQQNTEKAETTISNLKIRNLKEPSFCYTNKIVQLPQVF